MRQQELRKKLKLAKIENPDLFSYEDIADYLGIKVSSLYNWSSSAYNLSYEKEKKLAEWLSDLEE